MPPRTRSQGPQAPGGRRPRVAGLRDPRRPDEPEVEPTDPADPGETAEPTETVDGAAREDSEESPVESTTPETTAPVATTATPTAPAESAETTSAESTAPAETADESAAAPERAAAGDAATEAPAPARPGPIAAARQRLADPSRGLVAGLAVVTLVCLVLAGLGFWGGATARTSGPSANTAVVDTATTRDLVRQARTGIGQVFSYDFARLDDSPAAAREYGTADFLAQYQQIFDGSLRAQAAQQRARRSTTVLDVGVQRIEGDQATVMALVRFHTQRATPRQDSDTPGLLRLDMTRVGGAWKLAALRP